MELSRRDVLKLGVLSSAALLIPMERVARTKEATFTRLAPTALADLKYKAPMFVQPAAVKTPCDVPNVDFYDFVMRESQVNVLNVPGGKKQDYPLTRIWGYNGETPGPNIHVEQGVRTIVRHVNGRPWPVMQVEPRKYRFRVLNASVSRSYKFALTQTDGATSPDLTMTVIATDGGLMPKPQPVTYWRHGMAERYEVIIDFSKFRGKSLYLKNVGLPNNVDYPSTRDIMRFDVSAKDPTSLAGNTIPAVLNPNMDVMGLKDGTVNRRFQLVRTNGSWTVNGSTWVNVLNSQYGAPLASPKAGATEIWEIQNSSGGWFHPFHIHLVDFKVLSRNGKPAYAWEQGPKDVVYVGENETVRVAMKLAGPDNAAARQCYDEEAARLANGWTGQRTGRHAEREQPGRDVPERAAGGVGDEHVVRPRARPV